MRTSNFKVFTFIFLSMAFLFITCKEDKNYADDSYSIISVYAAGSTDQSRDIPTTKLIITVNDDNLALTADDIKINAVFPVIKGGIKKTDTEKTYELSITPGGTGIIKVGLDPYRGFTGWDAKNATVFADWYFSGTSELTITGCNISVFPFEKIPLVIAGLPVTAIGEKAFYDRGLTKVIIEDVEVNGIKIIGESAFANNQLSVIDIPNTVTTVGSTSFAYNQLSRVTIQKSVTFIGSGAFAYNQLTKIDIPDDIVSLEENVFAYNRLSEVTIPVSVTSIGYGVFGYNKLTEINIPDNVDFLSGFNNNEIEEISIPNSVTAIGAYAFAYNLLTNIDIPDNVKNIGSNAFSHNKLETVKLSDYIADIKTSTFAYNQLTEIDIPENVKNIGSYAFAYNKLTSVTIPSKVTYIDVQAFIDNQLVSITIGTNVTLGSSSFGNGFESFYYNNGRKKGTYTFTDDEWHYGSAP